MTSEPTTASADATIVDVTAASTLAARLEADPDADLATLATGTDKTLSIGVDVWRLRWRKQVTTAVTSAADLHTTCGALLDALAVLASIPADSEPGLDRTGINVLVDRPLPGDAPTETDQALRSMAQTVVGVTARIWYRRDPVGWCDDVAPAPVWPRRHPRVTDWVQRLQIPRLTAVPTGLAVELVDAVGDPSLQLYPAPISTTVTGLWSLRLDGLEIGRVDAATAVLGIGDDTASGAGPQRQAFIDVFGAPRITVAADEAHSPDTGVWSLERAAAGIGTLAARFRGDTAAVAGAPVTHRSTDAVPFVDEHALEARLLKGLVPFPGAGLVGGDTTVARGSQFPTLWGNDTRPRYLDALLVDGDTPVAVELKVATGGQGRYYRRSIIQAVLYACYLRHAHDLDPWFMAAGLCQHATRACIGVPIPTRRTDRYVTDLDRLRTVAAHVGVDVIELDDRATPELDVTVDHPSVDAALCETMSWRLAAALSRRWPRSLGRVVETHDAGGLYNSLQLRPVSDRRLDMMSVQPRVVLNRPGSVWVFNQLGDPRWVWHGVWELLADPAEGDSVADRAAVVIGAVAGLPAEASVAVTFAELAARFADRAGPSWTWRCAYGAGADWVTPYGRILARYRQSVDGRLPTIVRIWGAGRADDGTAAVIVDQENLRVWVHTNGTIQELDDPDEYARIDRAAYLTS